MYQCDFCKDYPQAQMTEDMKIGVVFCKKHRLTAIKLINKYTLEIAKLKQKFEEEITKLQDNA